MVLGLLYLGYLLARHPQRIVATGLVHLDAEPDEIEDETREVSR
jgi:hypothetical protein